MAQRPTKQLNVSELDFDKIKLNLKEFLRSQDKLQDYDFEGSALSTLIDVLSYVTHYNAVNANIGINETFLETAQSRGSVVGHARQLAYTPKSVTGAVASVSVQVNNPNSNELTLERGIRFRSVINNVSYTFSTTKSYITDNAFFADVELKQGINKKTSYIFDVQTSERFIIPDVNVDTTTIRVNVFDSVSSTIGATFVPVKNINQITSESKIYFLNEAFDGRYEITFGDGVIGQSLINGNSIEIEYFVTEGANSNGAAAFNLVDSIEGNAAATVTTNQTAIGGAPKESIKSIKYNAPLSFASQNRAVTPDDYRAIILENFSNAKSIVVWGGEDNDPPSYGTAFISIKPTNAETISTAEKNFIINDILKPKSVVSITPVFVDPIYTYVSLEVFYKFNSSETSLSASSLNSKVRTAILNYNDFALEKFDGVLRYSSLLSEIDNADKAVINSTVRVYIKKRFVPILNQTVKYELSFSSPIYNSSNQKSVIYKSTVFTYAGEQCTLQDYLNNNNERRVRVIRGAGVNQITVASDVGFIDAENGKIVLTTFNPSAFVGSYIELTVIPDSNDVAPNRNNLVSIDMKDVVVSGSNDRTITASAAGGLNYDLVSKSASSRLNPTTSSSSTGTATTTTTTTSTTVTSSSTNGGSTATTPSTPSTGTIGY